MNQEGTVMNQEGIHREGSEKLQDTVIVNRIVGRILYLGSVVSILLMAAGLVLYLLKSAPGEGERILGFRQALAGAWAFEPLALMNLGIIVLLLTPFLRVIGAFLSFLLVEKDFTYALISLGVLIILTVSLILPGLG